MYSPHMDKPHNESDAEYKAVASRAWYEGASVNPNNPMAVANQIEAAFKALEDIMSAVEKGKSVSAFVPALKNAKAILAAIKEA